MTRRRKLTANQKRAKHDPAIARIPISAAFHEATKPRTVQTSRDYGMDKDYGKARKAKCHSCGKDIFINKGIALELNPDVIGIHPNHICNSRNHSHTGKDIHLTHVCTSLQSTG